MFKDFNFKLVVVDALLTENPEFLTEFKQLVKQYNDSYKWYQAMEPIPQILEYLSTLKLEETDLDKIESIGICAGNDIYSMIQPDWDGEDDYFDIHSVEGFEHLKNLKIVYYSSLCEEEILEPFSQKGIAVDM